MNEFDKVGLYDHNAESYRKVREAFKENNVVGIVHATGTGKSYNALQLAYDNKDLKTIWVVPSNSIIEHIEKTINDNLNLDMDRDFPNLEFRTYQSFINMSTDEINDLDVDMLVLDEFHHTGAPIWGSRIDSIIETHPDIKVFGMTAYTVRDRGTSYERDMALDEGNELFSDNIVSRYDLCDAMIDGVLPKSVYKSSYIKLIDMASQLEERVKKLEASGRECSEYNKILSDVKKRIHEAPSLGETVKQNIKKNGKYIYFCPPAGEEGTNDIETIKKEAISWFKEIVPEEDIVIYTSLSEMEDSGKSNRDAFYDDLDLEGNKVDNKLRVMFAINQYNEGVHAPNLDGVIMGRGTCSDIVFFEQLGRALSVSSGVKEKIELYNTYSIERLRLMCSQKNINYNYDMDKEELIEKLVAPVIIDLAGNIDFIKELEDNLKDRIKEYQEKGLGTLTRRFLSDASFDLDMYELDLFNILVDLKDKTKMTWDDWYKLAEEYYKEHGNLEVPFKFKTSDGITYDENSGMYLGHWINNQRQNCNPNSPRGIKLLEIGMRFASMRQTKSWDEIYSYAEEYFREHGNLIVPKNYIVEGNYNLGQWVSDQRKFYKRKKLDQEKIAKLEKIGMAWNVYAAHWYAMYDWAMRYYQEHGDLRVSKNYVVKDGNLGHWIIQQRRNYRLNKLSKNQVDLLEKIGIEWDAKIDFDDLWHKNYEEARKYYKLFGNLNILQSYTTESGLKLGRWLTKQRISKNKGELSKEKIDLLDKIGMIWDKYDDHWDKMFLLAREYYNSHDDLRVGFDYTVEGENLGQWISGQRQQYKSGKLSQKRIDLLNSIGMIWDAKIDYDSQWNENFEIAQEYYKEHGDLNVPLDYVTRDGMKLRTWIANNRADYKSGKMPSNRIKKLESIGIIWDMIDFKWETYFEAARKYYQEHGDLEVLDRFKTTDNLSLGNWLAHQRGNYKNGKLSNERIDRLESIGMIWDINDKSFRKFYKYAEIYFQKHKNLSVPQRFKTSNGYEYDENGDINLGQWIANKRYEYKKGNLSDNYIIMLESIGMIWEPKKNKSDIRNLCENKNNNININKNKDIIEHISLAEFKVKLAYLKDNGINIVDENGILHEIFSMSSMSMKLKYGVSLEDLVNMYGKEKNK